MLASEASSRLDPLLVLHVRRKGRLRGIAGAHHRLVDQVDLVATVKPDVAQEASESVARGDIRFQIELAPDGQKLFEKCARLGAVALGWGVWVAGLRGVDEDEAHGLDLAADVDANRVAIGHADQRCRLRS
jgi:hypothetical protein